MSNTKAIKSVLVWKLSDKVGQIGYEDDKAWGLYEKSGYRQVATRVMAETTFRLIEHTSPKVALLTTSVGWPERLSDEPIVY